VYLLFSPLCLSLPFCFYRQVSLFHYLQHASHEPTFHPEWRNATLAEWDGGEDNWMTRVLSGVLESDGDPGRTLTNNDLHKAKGK
jgi:hypothetical protein